MAGIEQRAGLRGKRAIIIGGAFGVGRAVSLALAESGVDVAIGDIDGEALPKTVAEAAACGVTAFGDCFDATDLVALKAFYDKTGERFGHLDIVVNVAGGTYLQPFEDTGPEDWEEDIQKNFIYIIHSTKAALPLLRKSGRGGSIINFTTIEAHRGAATISVYAGAKAATTNFSRSLANELGHERIRVNTIAPDMTPSRTNEAAALKFGGTSMGSMPKEVLQQSVAIACPMGTAPSQDDLANGVLILASDLSAGITGNVLHVDGGTFASSGFLHWPSGKFSPLPSELVAAAAR